MPLYEYRCEACGWTFEIIQKFSDPPPAACTRCGKGPVHRQHSSPAIQFKGSGFYITDYARKGKSDTTASDQGEGKGAAAKPDGTATDGPAKTETAPKKDTPPAAGSSSPATGAKE